MANLAHLVWACLACRAEASLEAGKDHAACRRCGTRYQRGPLASIVVQPPGQSPRTLAPPEIEEALPPVGTCGSVRAEWRQSAGDTPLYVFGRYLGRIDHVGSPRPGTLTIGDGRLRFEADHGAGFDYSLLDLRSLQLSEHALQLKFKGQPVFSVKPIDASTKLWEERLAAAVAEAYARAGLGSIREYQPHIAPAAQTKGGGRRFRFAERLRKARTLNPQPPWQYRLCCWIARHGWKLFGGIEVEGLQHIPGTGPFLVIGNHQSYLEPVLVPAVMPRTIHAMAKTTQFKMRVAGWILPRIYAFPVRRFEIDPQAMRYTLRRMAEGFGILIFIEGERTWTGQLQPARLGVVRLAMRAGVPVIPCRITGAFEAWPRWGRPRGNRVRISFGPPLDLPAPKSRQECEAALPQAISLITDAIDPFKQ